MGKVRCGEKSTAKRGAENRRVSASAESHKRRAAESGQEQPSVKRFEPAADQGLTAAQVEERVRAGMVNRVKENLSKTEGQIVRDNIFTFFNLLFFLLAMCLFAVKAYTDMLFFGIIVVNTLIGIVQELRVKRTLDKITLLAVRDVTVIRDGQETALPPDRLVADDIVIFGQGSQICADAVLCQGSVEVNESLLTGESDVIAKKAGDQLLSGSFVTAGRCVARLERVGDESYAAGITGEARKRKKRRSQMMRSLDGLLKWIGLGIIPVGLILFLKQTALPDTGVPYAVSSTVASVVGMIPEGLYLLVSIALALSVIKLARNRTLVHELSCIENLARVDVLCLDKTGTITEGRMEVTELIPLTETPRRFAELLGAYVNTSESDNATARALKEHFDRPAGMETEFQGAVETPFSSERKWGALHLKDGRRYVLGAPEMILGERFAEYESSLGGFLAGGNRVLLLAETGPAETEPAGAGPAKAVRPLGFAVLSDKLRDNAGETLEYFKSQGVTIKVISGDNAEAVAAVAARAGVAGAEHYLDMERFEWEQREGEAEDEETESGRDGERRERALGDAAERNAVFGRVSPQQKRELISSLKRTGHTVAMIGDGVNDVLALKEADCSIAMAAGSEAAQHVSQMVLLHSDFAAMPQIVLEGRRVINNIQRSASLFLVKNIFSFLITMVLLFAAMPYPFVPIQLTLFSGLMIGIPSFLLTLEPSYERIKGKFMKTVLTNALPGGLVTAGSVLAVLWLGASAGIPMEELSSICTLLAGVNGLMVLLFLCWPLSLPRFALVTVMGACFFGAALFLAPMFRIESLSAAGWQLFLTAAAAGPIFMGAVVFGVSRFKNGGGGGSRRGKKRGVPGPGRSQIV